MSRGGSYRPLQPRPRPCRDCGAQIFMARSTSTGKWFPCEPAERGDVVVLQDGIHADILGPEAAAAWVGRKYRDHRVTCPGSRAYRRYWGIPEPSPREHAHAR